MTIVKENFMTTGLSGKFDNKVVFRQRHGKTIVAKVPRQREGLTPHQELRKQLFLKAVSYAAVALQDPETREMYRKLARLGATAYNMAVADFMVSPKVEMIDPVEYTGEPGSVITVIAIYNCKVRAVTVTITLADGGGA